MRTTIRMLMVVSMALAFTPALASDRLNTDRLLQDEQIQPTDQYLEYQYNEEGRTDMTGAGGREPESTSMPELMENYGNKGE